MRIRIQDSESFWPWIRDGEIQIRDKHPGSATLLGRSWLDKQSGRGMELYSKWDKELKDWAHVQESLQNAQSEHGGSRQINYEDGEPASGKHQENETSERSYMDHWRALPNYNQLQLVGLQGELKRRIFRWFQNRKVTSKQTKNNQLNQLK